MTKPVRHNGRRWAFICLAFVHAALLFPLQSCSRDSATDRDLHPLRYVLDWKQSKARALAPQLGWEVVNDLGYTVRVTRAYLVSRSIELVPCDPQARKVALPALLDTLIGPRPAFAGHSNIADPSASQSAQVESLQQASARQLSAVFPGAQRYCQAHYLVARADPQASGLPADVDMVDQTLRFEGTFQQPGRDTFEPFSVSTAVANGKMLPLTRSPEGALDTGRDAATIIFRRNLDTLFDRVDFSAMPEKRIAREILRNLIDGVEVEVRVGDGA